MDKKTIKQFLKFDWKKILLSFVIFFIIIFTIPFNPLMSPGGPTHYVTFIELILDSISYILIFGIGWGWIQSLILLILSSGIWYISYLISCLIIFVCNKIYLIYDLVKIINKKTIKEFFRPTQRKLLILAGLILGLFFEITLSLNSISPYGGGDTTVFPFQIFIGYPMMIFISLIEPILSINPPYLLSLIQFLLIILISVIFISLIYLYGCIFDYMYNYSKNKSWFIRLILLATIFLILFFPYTPHSIISYQGIPISEDLKCTQDINCTSAVGGEDWFCSLVNYKCRYNLTLEICEILPVSRDDCYKNYALRNKDFRFCEKSSRPSYCYYQLGRDLFNLSICDMATGSDKAKCYSEIATITDNIALCEEIEDFKGVGSRNYCKEEIWLKSGDLASCEQMVYKSTRNRCYFNVAMYQMNSTFCEKAGSYMNQCYNNIATKLNESSLCAMLEEKNKIYGSEMTTPESFRAACFFKLALRLKDRSLCEKVNDVFISEEGCSGSGAGYSRICSTNNWTLTKSMCIDEIEGRHHHIDCPRGGAFNSPCLYEILTEN